MRRFKVFNIAILFSLFTSCDNKEDIEPTYDYIKFDSGNASFLLNSEYDQTWNSYFKSSNQDQLGLVLKDEEGKLLAQIHLINSNFLNKSFPFTIDGQSDALKDGSAQMSLLNLTAQRDTIFNKTDSINYTNHSSGNFVLTINSFENDILKGNFYGTLKTITGKTKSIDHGRFKIKVKTK